MMRRRRASCLLFQMQDLNDEQKKSKLFVSSHGDEFGQMQDLNDEQKKSKLFVSSSW
jgi:hypothetical protein